MSNIILCGFKSSGKSTLARQIAEKTGLHYIDTDHLIGSDYPYLQDNPAIFREQEKKVIAALEEFQNCVIATGGGAILDPANVAVLKKLGKIFYLKVEKEELKRRLLKDPLPAFLDQESPEASFEKMYQEREPLYLSIADVVLQSSDVEDFLLKKYHHF